MSPVRVPFMGLKASNDLVRDDFLAALSGILDAGWYIRGSRSRSFEEAFAAFCGVTHCVGVGNGLDALVIALKALEVGPGDEVIVPANTFIATALAVSMVGATPVLVDPDPHTYNLDVSGIEAALTARTRVLMPVHLYGQACRMAPMMDLARRKGLLVVEDNAQAQGAHCGEQVTGSFGSLNGTSFYPGKNLGALGDAGAITTNDGLLAEKARMLGNYGSTVKYRHDLAGQNSRLDEIQAAVLELKLAHLADWNRERQLLAARYDEALAGLPDLILPHVAEGVEHVYHLYVVRTAQRDALQDHLTAQGVETLIHYPIPIHLQAAYASLGHQPGAFPISEELARTSLSLPLFPGMTAQQQDCVIEAVRAWSAARGRSASGTIA